MSASDGTIVQLTLAAEREGGLEAIRYLADNGVVPAVEHSAMTYDTARSAFEAGARILTHAFNGMAGIRHRAPGPVIAALRDESVWIEVINDGIYVHPSLVASLFAEAPGRVVLITDAMSATCEPDGDYMLGELDVIVHDGVARLKHRDSPAGSTLTMDKAVANAILTVGVSPQLAIAAATSHPAAALGLSQEYGLLATGYPADIIVLDPDTWLPRQIYIAGEKLR